jgi:threonine synthase
MGRLKGLKCRECGRYYPASPVHVCEFCFGPLEVDYDYDAIRQLVTRERIEAGPKSIWRYADLLPVELIPGEEAPAGSAAGFTPLIRARNLAEELGVRELYVKNDSVCHPTWSIKKDTDLLEPVRPNTIAKSLAIGNPADGYYAYRTTKDSGGYGEHATDEEIIEGMRLLARTEGIFTETAGGVTVAAARKLIESGRIPRDESIVICITGNGLKTPDVLHGILSSDVTIRPSLSAFDRALAELKAKPSNGRAHSLT